MPLRGIDHLARRLSRRIPDEVQAAAKAAIAKGADELVAEMKARVPQDQGKLRDSIGWSFDGAPDGAVSVGEVKGREFGKITATVYAGDSNTLVYNSRGATFQNARLQEFGTRGGTPASGYFLGAWRAKKRRIRSRITREVNKAIRRAYAKG